MMQSLAPNAPPVQAASKIIRSADGKMRMDYGNTSIITDPKAGQQMLLDHLTKEAKIFTMPPMPSAQMLPGGMPKPTLPGMPAMPVNTQDLGKQMIDGVMAEGKRYLIQPPPLPDMPQPPKLPNMPQPPTPPALPQAPNVQDMVEVWTDPQTQLPVLTKSVSKYGESICKCKCAVTADPPPSTFQVPPGYKKLVVPPKPEMPKFTPPPLTPPKPALPAPPAAPGLPAAATPPKPNLPPPPSAPSLPQANLPKPPAVPEVPKAPSLPQTPKPPKLPGF